MPTPYEKQLAATLAPEDKKEVGRLIRNGRNPSEALRSIADQRDVVAREQPSTLETAASGAMGFLDSVNPDPMTMALSGPLGPVVGGHLKLLNMATGADEGKEAAAEADPAAFGWGGAAGSAGSLVGLQGAARLAGKARAASKGAPSAPSAPDVPVLQRARDAVRAGAGALIERAPVGIGAGIGGAIGGPVGAGIGGLAGKGMLDDAAKALAARVRGKPPVAGPANAAAPTLDLPEPVLVPADDIGLGPVQSSGLDLDITRPVDDVPTRSSLTASELAPLKERMTAATPKGPPAAGNPRDATGNWSMTPDELNAAQGQVPGRPPVLIPEEGTSSMRRPRPQDIEVDDSMVLESAPVPPAEPTASPVPETPEAATVPVGGDRTSRIPKADLAELRLQAAAPPPDIAPPPPLSSIESFPVDPMQALAARARQRGIDQRFSVDGSRERAQLQALGSKAERQAFFDDLANIHGQRQTAPLAKEFALEMPSTAPRFSSLPGWMRQASNTGAHTGRQEASGAPWRDDAGNGPAIREAFAASRAPIADDAARGLALEAQAAATWDAAGNRVGGFSRDPNAPKYKPKDEAERAALEALPMDKFDAVIEGRMTLDEARAPSLAKAAPAPRPDATRQAIKPPSDLDNRAAAKHARMGARDRFNNMDPEERKAKLADLSPEYRAKMGLDELDIDAPRGKAIRQPPDAFDEPSFVRKSADEMGIGGDDLKSKTWHAREMGDAIEPGYVRAQAEKRRKEMALPLDRGEALREILQENGIDVAGIKERKIGALDNFDAGKDKKKIGSLAQAWSKSTRGKKSWDEIGNDLDALAEALGVEKLRLPERVRNLMERHAIEDAPDLKTNPARKIPK